MRSILLVSLLLVAACKKEEKKADPAAPAVAGQPAANAMGEADKAMGEANQAMGEANKAMAEANKAVATAGEAEKTAMAAAANAQAVAAVAIKNAAEYEKNTIALADKLLAIFAADGKNCDKLATDLSKFGDENRGMFEGLKGFEKGNPDAEKKLDEKMKPREDEFEKKLSPAFEACKDHAGMKAAMDKLPLE